MSRITTLVALSMVLLVAACDQRTEAPKAPAAGETGTAVPKIDPAAIKQKAEELVNDAKAKLDQVKSLVSETKLDQAEEILKKVEAIKDKLPADIQKLVDQGRSALDTARKAAKAVPAMPG